MKNIYFDNQAAAKVDDRVIKEMMPYYEDFFGNPLSLHQFGDKPREGIEKAREQVASLIKANPEEIYFTSCGTESNNLAIKGSALANQKKGIHIISSPIEHFSVLYPLKTLEKMGFDITFLPVDGKGYFSIKDLKKAIRKDTILISLTSASNEIGTLEPIAEIGQYIKDKDIIFHTDAIQTAGVLPVDVNRLNVNLLSLASNTYYGPLGVAALYIKKKTRILPQLEGGIQEDGRRSGSYNVPAIIGMGKAAELAMDEMNKRREKMVNLRDNLLERLEQEVEHILINGDKKNRLPGNINVCIKFVEGESMLLLLSDEGIALSSGSSCTSRALKSSHVLKAIGIHDADAQGSLLFSLSPYNTMQEIDFTLEKLPLIIERLRQMSPLYHKFLKGEDIYENV